MTVYRTDDLARWGSGKGSPLTPTEGDRNIWDLDQRLTTQEARPDPSAGITSFETIGTTFVVHMSDSTTLGPYALPVAIYTARGDWAPSTLYSVLDTFTQGGGLYQVIFAHTSASSFDPNANDGTHDYYQLMIQTPGSSLPTGGATGQILTKSTSIDYAVTWSYKLPTGGTSRQYLIKQSGTNQDSAWGTPRASDITFTPVTGSALSSSSVDDALEELSTALIDGAAGALSDLSDVLFATGDPISTELLYFNGTKWTGKLEADLSIGFDQIFGDASMAQLRPSGVTAMGDNGTVNVDTNQGNIFTTTPIGDIEFHCPVPQAGADITLIITTSGTSSFNLTFTTGFVAQGTLATGVSSGKVFAVKFAGTGFKLVEVSRTTAMTP